MKKVLQALDRNEKVKIYYYGKLKGILTPSESISKVKVKDPPFFGMHQEKDESVEDVMIQLRGDRYNVI